MTPICNIDLILTIDVVPRIEGRWIGYWKIEKSKKKVKFGVLFDDDKVANFYEALVGTLKAAKKRG